MAKTDKHAPLIQIGLYVVSAACVAAAALHFFYPKRIDETTAMLLGLAAVTLIIREIRKLELPGVKWERLEAKMEEVDRKVEMIEDQTVLPGNARASSPAIAAALHAGRDEEWNTDPNREQFGQNPGSNGRELTARIEPLFSATSAACKVTATVRSTNRDHPLKGEVTFYLHPTFGNDREITVTVRNGVARTEFNSWGVFTLGAAADNGKTRLGLDLAKVPGGTEKFYDN